MRGELYANYRIPFEYKDSQRGLLRLTGTETEQVDHYELNCLSHFLNYRGTITLYKAVQVLPEIDSESPLFLDLILLLSTIVLAEVVKIKRNC